ALVGRRIRGLAPVHARLEPRQHRQRGEVGVGHPAHFEHAERAHGEALGLALALRAVDDDDGASRLGLAVICHLDVLSQIGVPVAPSETDISTKINRGVAWSGASQAIVAISDMLSQMLVVAMWMSTDELGIAFMAIPLYSVLDAASDFGVTNALIQRDDHTPERVSTVFWFNVMLSGGMF